jgi:hypothetical protein
VIGGVAMARAGHQGGALVGEWQGEQLLYRGFADLGLSRGALDTLRTETQPLGRATSTLADLQRRKETVWLEPVPGLRSVTGESRVASSEIRCCGDSSRTVWIRQLVRVHRGVARRRAVEGVSGRRCRRPDSRTFFFRSLLGPCSSRASRLRYAEISANPGRLTGFQDAVSPVPARQRR